MVRLSQKEEDFLSLLSKKSLTITQVATAFSEVSNGTRKISISKIRLWLFWLKWRGLVNGHWIEHSSLQGDRSMNYRLTQKGEEALKEVHDYRQSLANWQH